MTKTNLELIKLCGKAGQVWKWSNQKKSLCALRLGSSRFDLLLGNSTTGPVFLMKIQQNEHLRKIRLIVNHVEQLIKTQQTLHSHLVCYKLIMFIRLKLKEFRCLNYN